MGLMPGAAFVYFHGIPGSPEELALFGAGDGIYAPDRAAVRLDLDLNAAFDALAADLAARFAGQPMSLIGFSLGSRAALEMAARLGDQVVRIDLVATAAPLESGDYLGAMAGKHVFALARLSGLLFRVLTALQALLVRVAPHWFCRQLFASAQGADAALAAQPAFRATMARILSHSLQQGAANYQREIRGFVQPWSALLPQIHQPVHLWHGEADNWAPPAMSAALLAALPNAVMENVAGPLSHYSTLRHFLERWQIIPGA
jgi:pimeloyl-ACP methyl ester carboxylesterase